MSNNLWGCCRTAYSRARIASLRAKPQLQELNLVIQQLRGTLQTQATVAVPPAATQLRPPPMRTLFDGTTSQLRSWRIAMEDRLMTDCAALPPRQRWIFVQDSLADPIQKRLAHYFESGESRGWDANAFVDYLDTLYADNTTIAVARLELHQLRKRFCWSLSELAQLQPGDRYRSVVGVKGIEVVTEPFTELVQLQPGASGWDPRDCPGQKSSVGGGKGRRSRSSACLR
ncbi:hypothetical protein E4U23_006588 [Claviceps purpurea]|nr:hypothetical protein E4U23_006588 [Claviceps purpurea]